MNCMMPFDYLVNEKKKDPEKIIADLSYCAKHPESPVRKASKARSLSTIKQFYMASKRLETWGQYLYIP